MDPFTDPEALRARESVSFEELRHVVEPDVFESVADGGENHVVVGVQNDRGEALLIDDGSHGWTLAAFPVESGEDWTAVARAGVREVTGLDVGLDRPERLRRITFENEETAEETAIYDVILRSTTVEGRPLADDPVVGGNALDDVGWFHWVPPKCDGPVAADIRLFVE